MTEFIAPGVYVSETLSRNRSISAVSTTTAAFVGRARRGPVYGITDTLASQPLTNVADFERIYGGFQTIGGLPNYLALAVRAYFDNGGTTLYVSRVAELPEPSTESAEGAETVVDTGSPDVNGRTGRAQSDLVIANDDPTKRVSFAARFPGEAGNATIVVTQVATPVTQALLDAAALGSMLRLVDSPIASGTPPDSTAATPSAATISARQPLATAAKLSAPAIASTLVSAHAKVPAAAAAAAAPAQPARSKSVIIGTPIAHAPQATVVVAHSYFVKGTDGWHDALGAVLDTAMLNAGLATPNGAALLTINVAPVDADGNSASLFAGLGFDPRHPQWLGAVLAAQPASAAEAAANFIEARIGKNVDAFALRAGLFGNGDSITVTLQHGDDGPAPSVAAYQRALTALERLRRVSTVAAPDAAAFPTILADVNTALVAHAERPGAFRMAVLDTAAGLTSAQALMAKGSIDSSYAAIYYPWVVVNNPLASPQSPSSSPSIAATVAIPPSGIVAGVFARSDQSRGVAKAPANEAVQGAVQLERVITDAEQNVLNPAGINALRSLPGRGLLVFGARTLSSDNEWKYVNVRRYFTYLEQSIDEGTQWSVFEPNAAPLWTSVSTMISNFLMLEWRSGALLGSKSDQAYLVRVDQTTMTQDDINNGRLVCLIGVAVLQPAEFVIFRIGQWTAGSAAAAQASSSSGGSSQNSDGSGTDP